jgi:isocitrate dehydrogenase (NAD+)
VGTLNSGNGNAQITKLNNAISNLNSGYTTAGEAYLRLVDVKQVQHWNSRGHFFAAAPGHGMKTAAWLLITVHCPLTSDSAMTPVVKIAGDGIGPEVMAATTTILAAAGARIDWCDAAAGLGAVERFGDPLPDASLDLIRKHRVALKGPCTTPIGKGFRSINVRLRQELDLYASVRPVRTLPGYNGPFQNVNLIVVRENTEGLYSGQEHVVVPGVVESLRLITRPACERIVRFAFEMARYQGRRKVTFCHKADVLPMSDGLFLTTARQVADDYPFLEFDELKIDTLCLHLALDPTKFDVLVMENLFGDVISDLCAGLVGGLGLTPGANIGTKVAVFEAIHGSAPDIAGKGVANPMALLRSAAMLLEHIGQRDAAARIERAVERTLQARKGLTRDLGGEGTTATLTEQLIAHL